MQELPPDRAVLTISVTSEMTEVAPQMLRVYEQRGLLAPARTPGGTRRYSGHDVARIRQITALLADGLNLAGIERVLALQAENARLVAEVARLRAREAGREGPRGR